jgi:hypothetical protein
MKGMITMKKINNGQSVISLLTLSLLAMLSCQTHAAIFSTFQAGTTDNDPIYYGNWDAQRFTTDGQYFLNSVTLQMGNQFADPGEGNFAVSIWTGTDTVPTTIFASLSGSSDPETAGNYTYSPFSSVTLDQGVNYWVVASVIASTGGKYSWTYLTGTVPPAQGGLRVGHSPIIRELLGQVKAAIMKTLRKWK